MLAGFAPAGATTGPTDGPTNVTQWSLEKISRTSRAA